MRKLLTIAWTSLLVRATDGGFLLLAVAAPLFVAALINLALGDIVLGRGVPEARLAVAVANGDRGGRWGNLGRAFEQVLLPGPDTPEPYARVFAARKIEDPAQAQRMVAQGQLVAALIIPPDFSESLSAGRAVIHVYVDGREEILGAAFRSAVDALAGTISTGEVAVRTTAHALMRDPVLRARLEAGQFDEALSDLALRAARPDANPIQIARVAPRDRGAGVRLTHYFAATIAIVLVSLFTLMTTASLFQEKAHGTLQRAYLSPTPPGIVLWGKTLGSYLGGLLLMAVLILGMAGVERLLGGGGDAVPLDRAGLALLSLGTVTAATGFGVAVAGLCQTYNQAASYGRALVIVMGLVGGIFFPASLFPSPLHLLSRLTFQYWAMDGYLTLALGGRLQDVLPPAAVLVGMGLVGMAGGSRLLQRRIAFDG